MSRTPIPGFKKGSLAVLVGI